MAFGLAATGFFLSWGTSHMGNSNDPFDRMPVHYSITLAHTGKNVSFGYAQLLCGIAGLAGAALSARSGWAAAAGIVVTPAAVIGLLIHALLRMDRRVTVFGSIEYALSHADPTLRYSLGPGLGVLGFLAAVICELTQPRRPPADA